jgi:phosphoribosylformylglycinamidine (FGAM) synthase PurS component
MLRTLKHPEILDPEHEAVTAALLQLLSVVSCL